MEFGVRPRIFFLNFRVSHRSSRISLLSQETTSRPVKFLSTNVIRLVSDIIAVGIDQVFPGLSQPKGRLTRQQIIRKYSYDRLSYRGSTIGYTLPWTFGFLCYYLSHNGGFSPFALESHSDTSWTRIREFHPHCRCRLL